MLASLDEPGGAAHHLRRHTLGLGTGEAHGDGAVNGGLEHEGEEGAAGAAQRRRDVHVPRGQVHDVADAAEDPGDEALDLRGQGRSAGGHDGHALADKGGRVGQGADDAAAAVDVWVQHAHGAVEDGLELGHGDARADGEEELAVQGFRHARLAQQGLDVGGLAGEEDDVGLHDRGDVLGAHNHLEQRRVLPELLLDALGGRGLPHRRDEPARQAGGRLVGVVVVAAGRCLEGFRGRHFEKGREDAAEDGDAHCAWRVGDMGISILECMFG